MSREPRPPRGRRRTVAERLSGLGLPEWIRGEPVTPRRVSKPSPEALGLEGGGDVAISVCTRSHLPLARVLFEDLRRFHPELALRLVVVDLLPGEPIDFDLAPCVPARLLEPRRFAWLALKLPPGELCCAVKPIALEAALDAGAERVLYLDGDLQLHRRVDDLFTPLATHDWVVTPHVRRLFDPEEPPGLEPSSGELTLTGVLNAGVIGVRSSEAARDFLDRWVGWVTAPGAFVGSWAGGRTEQQLFGWVLAERGRVHLVDDPSHNVAYWNLHERVLRLDRSDDGEERFTVDGRPLASFHWSGFDPLDSARVSRYDSRHSLLVEEALARLASRYRQRLFQAGWSEEEAVEWRWDRLASGIRIDARMRETFQRYEHWLDRGDDPWSPDGERRLGQALLSPLPATGSLAPLLFQEMLRSRADVLASFPRATVEPSTLRRWIVQHGIHEAEYQELWDRYRPVLPTPELAASAEEIRADPVLSRIEDPLGAGRSELLATLRVRGPARLCEAVDTGAEEIHADTPLSVARTLWRRREELRLRFPHPLHEDTEGFAAWLESEGAESYGLPAEVARAVRRAGGGRAFARVALAMAPDWKLQEKHLYGLVGEEIGGFAHDLWRAIAVEGLILDPDDVVAVTWVLDVEPWRGVPWLLELPIHQTSELSTALPEPQNAVLFPFLGRSREFRQALEAYQERRPALEVAIEQRQAEAYSGVRGAKARSARERLSDSGILPRRRPGAPAPPARAPGVEPGVNLFATHAAGSGVGALANGLARALGAGGLPVSRIALDPPRLEEHFDPDELLTAFSPTADTLLLTAHPLREELPLARLPLHRRLGRRRIAYLTWERTVGLPAWRDVYGEYDEIWAPSRAAARALAEGTGRSVPVVPFALDFDPEAARADRHALGVEADRFLVVAVLDPELPLMQQNPDGLFAAFRSAFRPDDRATLVLRLPDAAHPRDRSGLERLLARLPEDLDVRLRGEAPAPGAAEVEWLAAADAVLSLPHADDFGAHAIRAMAVGRPVVASETGGVLDTAGEASVWRVPVRESAVPRPCGAFPRGAVWAEPDVEAAAAALRAIRERPDEAAARAAEGRREALERHGEAAADTLRRHFTPEPSLDDSFGS